MIEKLSYENVVTRLASLLQEIAELDAPIAYAGPESIRQLGLTSVQLLRLLVEIENEFGIVWDEDLDESVVSAIDAMAWHIVSARPRSALAPAAKSEVADE